MDTRFGHPDDWGLSPQRHSEIASELSDHLDCLQADEGQEAAKTAEQKLAEPKVRRKLSSAHIADQLTTTLLRWPTPAEWREWIWLGFWFVLLAGGTAVWQFHDGIAADLTSGRGDPFGMFFEREPASLSILSAGMIGWLLSLAGRIGIVCIALAILLRSSSRGLGCVAARAIQMTIILSGTLAVGYWFLMQHSQMQSNYVAYQFTPVLKSQSLAYLGLGLAILLLFVGHRRTWLVSTGLAMFAVSAWFTGPGVVGHTQGPMKMSPKMLQSCLENGMDPARVNLDEGYAILDGTFATAPGAHFANNTFSQRRQLHGMTESELPADAVVVSYSLTAPYVDTIGSCSIIACLTLILTLFAGTALLITNRRNPSLLGMLHKPAAVIGTAYALFTLLVVMLRYPEAPFVNLLDARWLDYSTPLEFWVSSLLIHPFPQMIEAFKSGGFAGADFSSIAYLLFPASLMLLLSGFMLHTGKTGKHERLGETT